MWKGSSLNFLKYKQICLAQGTKSFVQSWWGSLNLRDSLRLEERLCQYRDSQWHQRTL